MEQKTSELTEQSLEKKYRNKFVKYTPIGHTERYGKVDRITVDDTRQPAMVIFVLEDNWQYEEELGDIHSLLTLL